MAANFWNSNDDRRSGPLWEVTAQYARRIVRDDSTMGLASDSGSLGSRFSQPQTFDSVRQRLRYFEFSYNTVAALSYPVEAK